jgi:hypothetical protein
MDELVNAWARPEEAGAEIWGREFMRRI